LAWAKPWPRQWQIRERFEAKRSGKKGIGLISGSLLFLLDKQVIISYTQSSNNETHLEVRIMQKIKIRIPVAKRAVIAHKSKKQYVRNNNIVVPNCSQCVNAEIQDSLECDRCWAECE
jgi:hypothetical protein